MNKMSREEAWELLTEYTKTPALRKHALAVEAVLKHFARLNDEDSEVWGVAGLLHDLDYEKFPDQHCQKAEEIMRESGVDETYIRAMKCHGYGICTDVKPCLLYTSDAADDMQCVDLGGRRIIKKKFFQAEDGIRDFCLSRGLGDVYKRQVSRSGALLYKNKITAISFGVNWYSASSC